MGSVETLESLVQKLGASTDADELTELVMNLKTALGHYSRAELADKIISNENVLLEALFGCLSPDPEHKQLVQNACDILKQIMGIADPGDMISKYSKDMLEGLEQHPLPEVRILVIAQLEKCLESEAVTEALCTNHPQLVSAVIQQHTFPELSVATRASKFLVNLARTPHGVEYLGSDEIVNQFQALIGSMDSRAQERYRLFETLANLATVSPALFEKLQGSMDLASTLSDIVFGDSDPLGGANALEILGTLAGTPFGLEVVTKIGVIQKIERLTQELDSNPLSALLFPETLKFIGKIGVNQLPPPRLREIVLETVVRTDLEIYVTTVAIEALSFIGCTKEGKQYLFGKAETHECFKKARQIVENSSTEYRVRVMDAMTVLFGTDEGTPACLPTWFNLLFPQISTLFDLVQQPFPDIRLSSLRFLTAIAPLEWAQRHYLRTTGVVEFLTNRDAEPDKECLIAKYKIVCIIADSPSASKLLSPENYGRLKIYKDQGPFYAPAISAVATEGSS